MSSSLVCSSSPTEGRKAPAASHPNENTSEDGSKEERPVSLRISASTMTTSTQSGTRTSPRVSPRYVETLSASTAVFKHVLFDEAAGGGKDTAGTKKPKAFVPGLGKFDLRKIKVVSFDLDDTLWDCESVIRKAEKALHTFLSERGHDEMVAHVSQPQLSTYHKMVHTMHPTQTYDVSFVRRRILHLAAKACHIEDETLVESAFEHFYHARTYHVSEHLFPGAVDAVARMKRLGLRIGTITNGNADVLKVPELAPYVEHHVNPEMAGSAKPATQIFDLLRSKFEGVRPEEILHVGDSMESDVRGALQAGMKACWVVSSGAEGGEEEGEILRVKHVEDLADMFEEALLDLS